MDNSIAQILGTHNSWSYLQPTHLWMYLFQPFSRCQGISISDQITDYGVRLLDLRIRFTAAGKLRVCHGLVDYKISSQELEDQIKDINESFPGFFIIRVLLDSRNPSTIEMECFRSFCHVLRMRYKGIMFIGGHGAHKPNWEEQYAEMDKPEPRIEEKYSSVSAKGFIRILPHLWAKKNNQECKKNAYRVSEPYLMLDFIEL